MKTILAILFLAPLTLALAQPQTGVSAPAKLIVKQDVPYAESADPRQKMDIYAPEGAKNLPVVFWIHGGGWQTGDRTNVQVKPQAFVDKGFVFVSTGKGIPPFLILHVADHPDVSAQAERLEAVLKDAGIPAMVGQPSFK